MFGTVEPVNNNSPSKMTSRFSLTTPQYAALKGCTHSALLTRHKRSGHVDGVKPRKQPNGRLLWPREAVFASVGLHKQGSTVADLRPGLAFAETQGLPVDDGAIQSLLLALAGKAPDERPAAHLLDDAVLIQQIIDAHLHRLARKWQDLTPIEQAQAQRQLEQCKAELEAQIQAANGSEEAL